MKRRAVGLRWPSTIVAAFVLVGGLIALPPAPSAQAVVAAQWDAGNIISDANFYNAYAMTEAEIQSFLNAKIGSCSNSNCLNVLSVPTTSKVDRYTTAGSLICRSYAGVTSETAAAIIFKVQQSCGISAKVLLVTLQKEQGLVTNRAPSDAKLSRAMGYGCPDTTGGTCDSTYYGFFNQMYSAAWQFKRYGLAPYTYNYQPGTEVIRLNPNAACGSTSVYIQNYATAALYNYTPYQPNAAALANLGGIGDACSTYGNRNFWVYYNNWFGTSTQPVGTPEGEWAVTTTVGQITITGWAVDPDAVTATVPVSVQIDQNWQATYANLAGLNLDAEYPGAGASHNFSANYVTTPGIHRLCLYLVNAGGAGGQGGLGCQSISVPAPPAPVGDIASVTATGGKIHVAGWAVQPDRPSTPVPLAINYGAQWISATADQPNSAAPTAVPGAGPNQGFAASFTANVGPQSFCIWAAPSSGPAIQLGCRTVTVPPAQPTAGALQTATAGASSISVTGWAVWPDSTADSVPVSINIGSQWYPVATNQPNPAGETAVPGSGPNHGFSQTFAAPPGTHSVCAWAVQPTAGAVSLGCKTVVVAAAAPTQFAVTSIAGGVSSVTVTGWAVWPASPSSSVSLAVNIGPNWYPVSANQPSAAAETAVPGSGPNHGFASTIAIAPGTYNACVWANVFGGGATQLGCQTVVVTAGPPTQFSIASIAGGVSSVSVSGWAVWPTALSSSVPLAVNIGAGWYPLTANQPSPAAATAIPGAGPNHGFSGSIAVAPGTYNACVWANNFGGGATMLGCQIVTVTSGLASRGEVTTAQGIGGGVTYSGWAVNPSTPTAAVNLAANIGGSWVPLVTADPNATAPTVVAGAGPNQGYSGFFPVGAGTHSFCVWAAGPSGAVNLGCRTVTVSAAPPVAGALTSVTASTNSVTIAGWAVWPSLPSTAVTVAVNIGSQWTALPSNLPNAAAQTAVPTAGPNQGFGGTVTAPKGSQNVCIWVARPGGAGVLLGCQVVTVP